jgi:hypothetical protein
MIQLHHDDGRTVALHFSGQLLAQYVYVTQGPANESPRPYFHPLKSLRGDTLSNFRPNDHPWHHGLSLTLNTISGVNFWGGPTYLRDKGYQWLSNHGSQHHVAWSKLEAVGSSAHLEHTLEWRHRGEVLFRETRSLRIVVDADAKSWSLRWLSQLSNVSGRTLTLGNPQSNGGLAGSHYTGLQFRGAREFLDEHLDPAIRVLAEGGREGVDAVHGANAKWVEWRGQVDTSLHRVTIRFENNSGPLHWFMRRHSPLMAFPVQFSENLDIPAGEQLTLDHTLSFKSE